MNKLCRYIRDCLHDYITYPQPPENMEITSERIMTHKGFGWTIVDERNRVEDLYTQRYNALFTIFTIIAAAFQINFSTFTAVIILIIGITCLFVLALLIDVISRKLYYISQLVYKQPLESVHRTIKKCKYEKTTISPILFFLGSVLPMLLVISIALIGLDHLLRNLGTNCALCSCYCSCWFRLFLIQLIIVFFSCLFLCLRRATAKGFNN